MCSWQPSLSPTHDDYSLHQSKDDKANAFSKGPFADRSNSNMRKRLLVLLSLESGIEAGYNTIPVQTRKSWYKTSSHLRFPRIDFHFLISKNAHRLAMRCKSPRATKTVIRQFDRTKKIQPKTWAILIGPRKSSVVPKKQRWKIEIKFGKTRF